jgi:hypothetical protein
MEKQKLTEKEKKVIDAMPKSGESIAIVELAKKAFPGMGHASRTRGNSWVRNSLRRPVAFKLVKQTGRGLYSRLASPKKPTKKKAPAKSAKAKSSTPKAPPISASDFISDVETAVYASPEL